MIHPPAGPGEYLARLWDNHATTQPVTPLERRLVKRGLLVIGQPAAVFGHVRRDITDEGRRARDAFVAETARSLPAWLDDVLADAERRVVVESHNIVLAGAERRALVRVPPLPPHVVTLTAFGRAVLALRRSATAARSAP